MVDFIKKLTAKVQIAKNWLLAIYLIFAVYLIIDGTIYLLSPYSGRISVLDCTQEVNRRTICTITIVGIKETSQRSFWADDFRFAKTILNLELGVSSESTCGVAIIATNEQTGQTEQIDFVHQYQDCSKAGRTTDRISQMFIDSELSSPRRIVHIGFNTSLYLRLLVLVVGLLFTLTYHHFWKPILRSETTPRLLRPAIEKGTFRNFAFSWWRTNFLFRVIFLLLIFFISGLWSTSHSTIKGDFTSVSCDFVFRKYEGFSKFPISNLICHYPLVAYMVIQAFLQWKLLKSEVKVSGLWVAAPALASFVPVLWPFDFVCEYCQFVKFLFAGLLVEWPIILVLTIYLLIVGFVQWLAIRRSLSSSIGWTFVLPINTILVLMLGFGIGVLIELGIHVLINLLVGPILRFLYMFSFILMISINLIVSDIIPAIFISWLIHKKNSNMG